ncbi:MAG: YdcF family protein [Leptolyngbyaceae cyanobacterium bins.59]|nr:YdcF family protein [Leptolyngbyaceae cyanobacterium bins.59]
MFFYLSKLLPLFIYPLGFACLLLLIALFTVWKRPRISAILIGSSLGVLLLASNTWVNGQLVQGLEWQNIPPGSLPNADAIVVLGGGIKPVAPPRPGVDLAEGGDRIIYGIQLYRQGKAPWLVLSGGRVTWRAGGGIGSESGDMAMIATDFGVPKSAILEDATSLNTYQNAVNVKQVLSSHQIKRVLLVTSAIHMPRSLAIFKRQGIDAIAAPTDFLMTQTDPEEMTSTLKGFFLGMLPDIERLGTTTRALKEYIGLVVYRLRGWL